MSYHIELGGTLPNGFFSRNLQFPYDESMAPKINSFRDQCNNTDVYYCTYLYDNVKDRTTSNFYSPLYFDIDGDALVEEGFELVRHDALVLISYLKTFFKLKDEDFQVFFSGSKGFHILIAPVILGIKPDPFLNVVYKSLVVHFSKTLNIDTIDTKIYDNKRLLRFANSINSKTGLYKVPLSMEQLRMLNLNAIKYYASTPHPVRNVTPEFNRYAAEELRKRLSGIQKEAKKLLGRPKKSVYIPKQKKDLLPCVKKLLQSTAIEGCRNNTLVLLASSLLQSGWSREETLCVLYEWNDNNEPPLPESEIDRTAQSAEAMLTNGRTYGCGSYLDTDIVDAECCKNCRARKNKTK